MNNDKFEQNDKDMMENLKGAREEKVPREILKGFSQSVEKRIVEGQQSGNHYSVGAVVLVGAFMFALGISVTWFVMNQPKKQAEEVVVQTPTVIAREVKQEKPAKQEVPVAEVKEVVPPVQVEASPKIVESPAEEDLMSEIEVLRELGIWTDEDELEVGISSMEDSLLDMEILLDGMGEIVSPSAVIVS